MLEKLRIERNIYSIDSIENLTFQQHFTYISKCEIRFQTTHFQFQVYSTTIISLSQHFSTRLIIHSSLYPSHNKYWLFVNTYFIIFYHFAFLLHICMNIEGVVEGSAVDVVEETHYNWMWMKMASGGVFENHQWDEKCIQALRVLCWCFLRHTS
jgi:hypothetical protein